MKKLVITLAILAAGQFSFAQQSVMDLAAKAACDAQDNLLKPIIKSSEHEKRGIKASTWVRLAEAYANHTTACGMDSTSAIKAWDAIAKAKELDTDGKSAEEIENFKKGELMYSAAMNQGVAHYNNGNLKTAVELFRIGAMVDPDDTVSTFYAGIVANQLEDYDNAEKSFSQYIDVAKGRDAAAYYTLSQIAKNQKKDTKGAIGWLKKGVEETNDKDLRGELINTYIQNDMLDEAIGDLEALIANDPNNPNTLINLGLLYDNKGYKEKALDVYNKVLKIDPNNYDANFSLAVLSFNEAVKIKNEVDAMDIKTYQSQGKAIEQKSCAKFQESLPYFEKCNEVRPNEAEVVQNLETLKKVLAQCAK